jgi:hypothetical protein
MMIGDKNKVPKYIHIGKVTTLRGTSSGNAACNKISLDKESYRKRVSK